MNEYLSKKAVLEWVLHKKTWRSWDDYCEVQEAIQSGAFDAPEMEHINAYWAREGLIKHQEAEVQRLRAAAIKLHETLNTFWQNDCDKSAVVNAQSNLCDTLSTTTEPTGAERVRDKMKSLFEAWDLRGICKDSLEGYEQGVMLELIGLCEEIAGINAPEGDKP